MKRISFFIIGSIFLACLVAPSAFAADPFTNPPAYFLEAKKVWEKLIPVNNDHYMKGYLSGEFVSTSSINEPLLGMLYAREHFKETRWDPAIHFMATDYATRLLNGTQPASWNLWAAGLSEYSRIFKKDFPDKTAHVDNAIRHYSQHGAYVIGTLWTSWFPDRARECFVALGALTQELVIGAPFAPGFNTGSPGDDANVTNFSQRAGWKALGGGRQTRLELLLDMTLMEPKTHGNWSALDSHGHFHHWFDNTVPMIQPDKHGRHYVHTLFVAYWANYLLRHYRLVDKDPRIPASISAAADWMIKYAWLGPKDPDNPTSTERNEFVQADDHGTPRTLPAYPWHLAYDVQLENDRLTPSSHDKQNFAAISGAPNVIDQWAGLNLLHVGWIASAYHFTGDVKYIKFADALFKGWADYYKVRADHGMLMGIKQWAQAIEWMREYFTIYRQPIGTKSSSDVAPPSAPINFEAR